MRRARAQALLRCGWWLVSRERGAELAVAGMKVLEGRVRPLQRTQIAEAYWLTDLSVAEIAKRYRSSVRQIGRLAGPAEVIAAPCPVCGKAFVARDRSEAIKLVDWPSYSSDSDQGLVPVCCGPWVSWYYPLDKGDHARGEPGGGEIGQRWRELKAQWKQDFASRRSR